MAKIFVASQRWETDKKANAGERQQDRVFLCKESDSRDRSNEIEREREREREKGLETPILHGGI